MAVVRNTGFRPQMLRWELVVAPRNSVDVPDAEWGDIRKRAPIRDRLDDGTLVVEGASPLPPVSGEEREAAGTDIETVESEVAVDLDAMDRDALKAFAESQEITDAVDLRLGTDKLRAAIKAAIA